MRKTKRRIKDSGIKKKEKGIIGKIKGRTKLRRKDGRNKKEASEEKKKKKKRKEKAGGKEPWWRL